MVLKKKASKSKAELLRAKKHTATKESLDSVDSRQMMELVSKSVSDAVDKAVAKGILETQLIAKAIQDRPQPETQVQLVQNQAPAIKNIKVTNISRDSRGLIKDMDMKVERESIH